MTPDTPEQWQHVKDLFHTALDRAPEERRTFLDEACAGRESLRPQVEALIAAHEREGDFLNSPAYEVAAEMIVKDEAGSLEGQSIGHYEIVARLGSGGMGEVYRARDKKLGRSIALKLIPFYFTTNADRLQRFQREARAASALNHPNVCVIHEVGETEGGRYFIAMEYIEGVTLREHMSAAQMKMNDILEVAIQIASALAASHDAGIIHRDIKPENIMLRRDGYVKVLDFGLAKLTDKREGALNESKRVSTEAGTLMGTAGYLSPEQAKGLKADARTDLWSLGVVIYEMVAGRQPFDASSSAESLAMMLEREPPPLARYSLDVSGELERIVMKALQKEPGQRYQTARDFLNDLRRLKQRLAVDAEIERSVPPEFQSKLSNAGNGKTTGAKAMANTSGLTASTLEHVLAARKINPIRVLILTVILAGAVGALLYLYFRHGTASNSAAGSFRHINETKLTTTGNARDAAISPDGKYVVYSMSEGGKQSLWVRQMAIARDVQIVPPSDIGYLALTFSPDDSYIYYGKLEGEHTGALYKISTLGGPATRVIGELGGPGAFSPDGKQMAYIHYDRSTEENGLVVSNTDGTEARTIISRKRPWSFGWPAWSPDGKALACAVSDPGTKGYFEYLEEVRIADGFERRLSTQQWEGVGQPAWLSDGSGLLVAAKDQDSSFIQIWRVSYPGGEAQRLTNSIGDYSGISSTADTSTLVTVQSQVLSNIWTTSAGNAGHSTQITHGSGRYFDFAWAPDGKLLYASDVNGVADIWEIAADGSGQKQLTAGARRNYAPAVSPDGRYIVFHSNRAGSTWNIWRMDRDGSNAVKLTDGATDSNWPQVSPDGKWVVYHHIEQLGPTLWKAPIDGGTPVRLTSTSVVRPAISPDGRFIACWSDQHASRRGTVSIISFEGGAPIKTFELPAPLGSLWENPIRWTPDGRALAYNNDQNGVSNIWIQPIDGSPPRQATDFKDNSSIFSFDLSRDGRIVCSRGSKTSDVVMMSDTK